ncbi:hypothetical protein GCM10027185_13420 [Spirosoma pulveris]
MPELHTKDRRAGLPEKQQFSGARTPVHVSTYPYKLKGCRVAEPLEITDYQYQTRNEKAPYNRQ